MEKKLKNYELSVLVFLQNKDPRYERWLEEELDYVGLSGRELRKIVETEQEFRRELQNNNYHFVIGILPSDISIDPSQVHIAPPAPNHTLNQYFAFLTNLKKGLEEKFGINEAYWKR